MNTRNKLSLKSQMQSHRKSEALTSQHHIKLDKKKFVMPDGIKTLGTTTVDVKIYTGVVGKLNVVVEQI